jgi:hypothetical protein
MRGELYIKELETIFNFLCDLERQKNEWLHLNSDFNLSYDEIYYEFMNNLGGKFMIENRWDWGDGIIFSDQLKELLKDFTKTYNDFFQLENFPYNSR